LNDVKIDRDDAQYREGRRERIKKKTDLSGLLFSFFFIKKGKREREGGQRKFVSLVFREEQEEKDGKKK